MDGNYQNKILKYHRYLLSWVHSSIDNKAWIKYDDLHIDEIDQEFRDSRVWIKGSFFLYGVVLNILKNDIYSCLLAIPLCQSEEKLDFVGIKWGKVEELIDETPPSFYLFPKGEKNFEETVASSEFLESLSNDCGYKVFSKQKRDIDNSYSRVLYIIDR